VDTRASDATRVCREVVVRKIPIWRKLLYVVTIWIALFLVAELAARIGGYFLYGRSPYFLFYGIKSFMADADPEGHSAAFDGYFKFPPRRTLHQYGLFKKATPIRINAHGFRGPEFETRKPESVIRIVCVGESSTFGFYNTDDGTYPALLSRLLNDPGGRGHQSPYEVINAGIPHANSDNIRALVEKELLGYRPDVLTLYAGYNDASVLMSPSTAHKVLTWLHGHIASYVAFKAVVTKLGGPTLPSRWSTHGAESTSSHVDQQVRLHSQRYRANVEHVVQAARANGVKIVLVKQAMTTGWGDGSGLTYQEKVENARRSLASGKQISGAETTMIVHAALMSILDSVAAEHKLPLIDYIAEVNRHPEFFASYVHLTEAGNLALAQALSAVVKTLARP
jgi:lysophospholipase L1-like esterase